MAKVTGPAHSFDASVAWSSSKAVFSASMSPPQTSAPLYDLNDAKGVADLIKTRFLSSDDFLQSDVSYLSNHHTGWISEKQPVAFQTIVNSRHLIVWFGGLETVSYCAHSQKNA